MKSLSLKQTISTQIVALFWIGLFSVSLALSSLGKDLWLDETNAIYYDIRTSYGELIQSPPTQCSPAPLHYLAEKAWISAWDSYPQRHWDLKLFYRILPSFYWLSATIVVFFYSLRKLSRNSEEFSHFIALLLSSAIALFYFSNPFALYYAREARPYSLWLALSTTHLLFFSESELGLFQWILYGLNCVLLTAVANVGFAQVALGLLLSQVLSPKSKDKIIEKKDVLHSGIIFTICLLIAYWYATQTPDCGYAVPTFHQYVSGVHEVIRGSFHINNFWFSYLMFPLVSLGVPWAFRCSQTLKKMTAFLWLELLMTFVFFGLCIHKHFFVASRQYIFLTPILSWFFFAGLWLTYESIGPRLRKQRKIGIIFIALIYLVIELNNIGEQIKAKLSRAIVARAFHTTTQTACTKTLPISPKEVNFLNQICRDAISH